MEREMFLYVCTDCVLVFAVETTYEDHSQIVCPVCQSDEQIRDAGTFVSILTELPDSDAS